MLGVLALSAGAWLGQRAADQRLAAAAAQEAERRRHHHDQQAAELAALADAAARLQAQAQALGGLVGGAPPAELDEVIELSTELGAWAELRRGGPAGPARPFDPRGLLTEAVAAQVARGRPARIDPAAGLTPLQLGEPGRARLLLRRMLAAAAARPGARSVLASARLTDDALIFEVHDDGDAMSPEEIVRVLQPDGAPSGPRLAPALARAMGGRLQIESAPGLGTRAVARLPRADAPARAGDTGAQLRGRRVLLIHQDPLQGRILRDTLEGLGLQVEISGDPNAAGRRGREARAEGAPLDAILALAPRDDAPLAAAAGRAAGELPFLHVAAPLRATELTAALLGVLPPPPPAGAGLRVLLVGAEGPILAPLHARLTALGAAVTRAATAEPGAAAAVDLVLLEAGPALGGRAAAALRAQLGELCPPVVHLAETAPGVPAGAGLRPDAELAELEDLLSRVPAARLPEARRGA